MLVAVAATATIVAQKDRGGGTETGVPPVAIPRAGTLPVANEVTNTLHFADIAVGTNTVTLAVAWPSGLFAVGTTIDLLATTSLVESVWGWRQAHDVAAGETNWTVTVEKERVSRFYKAVVRDSLADMDDFDGDGLPNVYELVNGTNPYVDDYASAPKLTVGPSGSYEAVEDAVSASEPYSIIEIDPSVTHEVTDYLGVEIPQHPLMVTAPHPYAIVRATGIAAFMLATNTTSQTLFRNLYLLLDAKDSFQAGFWCGGSVPMSGVPAAATFENIYVRMPNPEVQYRGWILYRKCADQVSLCGCTLNAAGATWAIGIDAFGSPPFEIDSCSFVNFPPDNASQTGCGVLLRTSNSSAGGLT